MKYNTCDIYETYIHTYIYAHIYVHMHVYTTVATSCHIMYLMSRHATLCHVMSRNVTYVMSYHVSSCHVMSRQATSRNVTSCHVMSRHGTSRRKSRDGNTTNASLSTDFFHTQLIQISHNRVRWLSRRVPIPYRISRI